jgi:hypothetical protein
MRVVARRWTLLLCLAALALFAAACDRQDLENNSVSEHTPSGSVPAKMPDGVAAPEPGAAPSAKPTTEPTLPDASAPTGATAPVVASGPAGAPVSEAPTTPAAPNTPPPAHH